MLGGEKPWSVAVQDSGSDEDTRHFQPVHCLRSIVADRPGLENRTACLVGATGHKGVDIHSFFRALYRHLAQILDKPITSVVHSA
jgi:hypothetical protein